MAKNKPVIFVRSILDLGDYCDDEKASSLLPSLTDPSQDEPIAKLLARMMRGEVIGGNPVHYDDMTGVESVDDAFGRMPVYARSGFDLADVPGVIQAGVEAQAALDAAAKAAEQAKPAVPAEPKATEEPKPN